MQISPGPTDSDVLEANTTVHASMAGDRGRTLVEAVVFHRFEMEMVYISLLQCGTAARSRKIFKKQLLLHPESAS